jgi:hypothetical protein
VQFKVFSDLMPEKKSYPGLNWLIIQNLFRILTVGIPCFPLDECVAPIFQNRAALGVLGRWPTSHFLIFSGNGINPSVLI